MKIIIVRHAQTEHNLREIAQSQSGGSLSEIGIRQAKRLAKRLSREKIDIVISSDSKRAKETAMHIMEFQHAQVAYDPLLRERQMGSFVGKPMKQFRLARENSGVKKWEFKDKRGESYIDLRKRAEKFANKLKKRKENSILIISHGGLIKMLVGALMGINVPKAFEIQQDNACVNVIEMMENPRKGHFKFTLKLLNCTRHLRGLK